LVGCVQSSYTFLLLLLLLPWCCCLLLQYDQFHLNPVLAGALGSIFGMMNIFTRASGGMISGNPASTSPSHQRCIQRHAPSCSEL
jgi:nitrate/nitrite transporter NarK